MANAKRSGALVLRLIVGLALLGWPRVGSAQGTWSVISLPQKPGEVLQPEARCPGESVMATLARGRCRVQRLSLTKHTCLRPAGVRTPVLGGELRPN
jgi:hypothetical protein